MCLGFDRFVVCMGERSTHQCSNSVATMRAIMEIFTYGHLEPRGAAGVDAGMQLQLEVVLAMAMAATIR